MSESQQMEPVESPLVVTLRTLDGSEAEIVVAGEVDAFTQDLLREQLLDVVARGATHVVVDLSDVSFLDSSGLRGMVEALQRGATLTLRHLQPAVQRVFDVVTIPGITIEP